MPKIDNTFIGDAAEEPFAGSALSTVQVPVSTTSANVPLALPAGGQVRIVNSGASAARISWGTSNAAAATTPAPGSLVGSTYTTPTLGSKLILPGTIEILTAPVGTTHVAFKTDSGSTTLEFTPGMGL